MDRRQRKRTSNNKRNNLKPRQTVNFKNKSNNSVQRKPLVLQAPKINSQPKYILAKGPDGTRGFYTRSKQLNASARVFVPSF